KKPAVPAFFYWAGTGSGAGAVAADSALTFGFQLSILGESMTLLLTSKLLTVGEGFTPFDIQYSIRSFLTLRFFLCGSYEPSNSKNSPCGFLVCSVTTKRKYA